jgi:hypothetical protein
VGCRIGEQEKIIVRSSLLNRHSHLSLCAPCHVSLHGNNISDPGAASLGEALQVNATLRVLK